jgi:hypothetical protein
MAKMRMTTSDIRKTKKYLNLSESALGVFKAAKLVLRKQPSLNSLKTFSIRA